MQKRIDAAGCVDYFQIPVSSGAPHAETTGEEIAGRLRRLLVLIHRDIAGLHSRTEERVHNIRVQTKKFRALLRLATFGARTGPAHEADRIARDLKGQFASARDNDVLRELLLDLFEASKARRLAAELGLNETANAGPHVGGSDTPTLAQLEAATGGLSLAHLTPTRIYDSWTRTYGAGRKALKTAARRGRDEDFHEWRKRVKELLYQSQAIGGVPVVARIVRPLEKLASLLGSHHDLSMLDARFESHLPGSAASGLVRKRKAALGRRALRAGEKLFAQRPSAIRLRFPSR